MLDIKEAFKKVQETIIDIIGADVRDIRLEEVEFSTNKENWELIVSYLLPNKNKRKETSFAYALMASGDYEYERVYKKFVVGRLDGVVKSIKLYKDSQ